MFGDGKKCIPSEWRAAALPSAEGVAQVSKPAVSRVSKPANRCQYQVRRRIPRHADLEVGDTAGLETCATYEADPGPRLSEPQRLVMPKRLRLQGKPRLGGGRAAARRAAGRHSHFWGRKKEGQREKGLSCRGAGEHRHPVTAPTPRPSDTPTQIEPLHLEEPRAIAGRPKTIPTA